MKKISERALYNGQWLTLHETTYQTKNGDVIHWESVRRTREALGLVVIPQLMPSRRFVLIKQYRPAIEGYILGFPAGLSEGREDDALRELKEETGYTGAIVATSPFLKSNSGVINDSGLATLVHIDEEHPDNINPQQALEPSEDIEVIVLPFDEARDYILNEFDNGTQVGSNLWYLFCLAPLLGLSMV
jgi:ADP-ribose pyrophosphatase